MRKFLTAVGAAVIVCLGGLAGAQAASYGVPESVSAFVQFGTKTDDMVITPNTLVFERGKLYRLVIENPSDITHYFTPLQFREIVKTRSVQVTRGEVQGINRHGGRFALNAAPYRLTKIEIRPGGSGEWLFEPLQAGTFDFQCDVPAHANAGMVGKIVVN